MSSGWNLLDQSQYPGNGDQALHWPSWFTHENVPNVDCAFPSYSSDDCSNATNCINEKRLVFQSPRYFLTCAVYPNISHDISKGTIPDLEAASKYNMTNDFSLAADITKALSSCLYAYCNILPSCRARLDTGFTCSPYALETGDGSMLSAVATNDCWSTLCSEAIASSINTDIAGIGILSSYFIQSSITVLGYISLSCLGLFRLYLQIRDKDVPHFPKRENQQPSQTTKTTYKQCQLLIISLVDFHKTQCFFAMAVQIAALISSRTMQYPLSGLDINALSVVSSIGVVPIILNLYTMLTFNYERTSWYLCGLSLCTEALSIATAYIAASSLFYGYDYNQIGPEECGAVPLTALCLPFENQAYAEFDRYGVLGVISSSLYRLYPLLLVISLGLSLCRPEVGRLGPVKAAQKALNNIYVAVKRYLPTLPGEKFVQVAHVEITIVIKYYFPSLPRKALIWKYLGHICMCLILSYSLLGQYNQFLQLYKGSKETNWGFGQIVGITIWLPAIAEYLYLQISGIEEGSKQRFPAPLILVDPSTGYENLGETRKEHIRIPEARANQKNSSLDVDIEMEYLLQAPRPAFTAPPGLP